MNHDLEDLIEMIKALETRIIALERMLENSELSTNAISMGEEGWYFHY